MVNKPEVSIQIWSADNNFDYATGDLVNPVAIGKVKSVSHLLSATSTPQYDMTYQCMNVVGGRIGCLDDSYQKINLTECLAIVIDCIDLCYEE